MQIQKNKVEMSGLRVEIKADFSKDIKNLDSQELNSLINNFRRYKSMQMDRLRKESPLFGMSPTGHGFDKEKREKIMELLKDVIDGKNISEERIDDNYGEALNIIDWYNEKKEEWLKEGRTKELAAQK